jgi:hypothetical protein
MIATQNQNWERQRPADHSTDQFQELERIPTAHFHELTFRLVAIAPSSDFV